MDSVSYFKYPLHGQIEVGNVCHCWLEARVFYACWQWTTSVYNRLILSTSNSNFFSFLKRTFPHFWGQKHRVEAWFCSLKLYIQASTCFHCIFSWSGMRNRCIGFVHPILSCRVMWLSVLQNNGMCCQDGGNSGRTYKMCTYLSLMKLIWLVENQG